ncbi:hypothetical protein [Tenacibaculum finnmarkense]|nr:hypothetical protein [Tenacibaculum finnmarkense]
MKTFDIETFNENKIGNEYNFKLEDGTKINQQELPNNEYIERINPKNSYFQTLNRYYYSNKKLKSTVQLFPNDFLVGILKEYDQFGNLINEIDYDKPFKFTWEDILKWLQKNKISSSNDYLQINRGSSSEGTTWAITWEKDDESGLKGVNIDGITGKVTRTFERDYPEE